MREFREDLSRRLVCTTYEGAVSARSDRKDTDTTRFRIRRRPSGQFHLVTKVLVPA